MQPITTDHGEYKFVRIYKGQTASDPITRIKTGVNGGIGELDSGAWVWYPQCLPIANPNEAIKLLDSVNPDGTARFKRWWVAEQNRLEQEALEPVARTIKIVVCPEPPGSKLVYDDGSEEDVTDAGAVVAFYAQPGPLQALAMSIFGARYQTEKQEAMREELETPRAKLARELINKREAKKPGRKPAPAKKAVAYGRKPLPARLAHLAEYVGVGTGEGEDDAAR